MWLLTLKPEQTQALSPTWAPGAAPPNIAYAVGNGDGEGKHMPGEPSENLWSGGDGGLPNKHIAHSVLC